MSADKNARSNGSSRTRKRRAVLTAVFLAPGLALAAFTGCNQRAGSSELTSFRGERPAPQFDMPEARVLARASTRALATTPNEVLFGDAARNALLSVPKAGGEPRRIGERAPLDIAPLGSHVAWIGAPGDIIYRGPLGEGKPDILLAKGMFSALTAQGAELFVAELIGLDGAVIRVQGRSSSRLAALDYHPRELVADETDVYLLADSEIHALSHGGGALRTIAAGHLFSGLVLDGDFLFTSSETPTGRELVRVPKHGGAADVVAREVRNGPLATWGKHVYFFGREGHELWHVPVDGGERRLVARSPELGWAVALSVDASGIYVALDRREGGMIIALPHPV